MSDHVGQIGQQSIKLSAVVPLHDCGPLALTPASESVGALKGLGLGFSCREVTPDGITDPGATLLRRAEFSARVVNSVHEDARGPPEQAVNKCKDSMQSGHAS
jgi:hypothetical protein